MQIFRSIFLFWGFTGISLHDLQFKKTPYLSYTDPLCSPSVQPLSETGCFSSCLFKAPLLMSPLCSDWPASGSLARGSMYRLCKVAADENPTQS